MIGMPTGSGTGIFVVDLDTKSDGPKHFADLCKQHGGQPITRTATTPSGGQHLYFRWPQSRIVRNSTSKLGKGIDIRGEGGYVIAPPSRRNDGLAYRWNSSETDVDIASAPTWLLDLIDPPPTTSLVSSTIETPGSSGAQAALRSELGRVLSASLGERNDILNRASFALGQIVAGGALAHNEVFARLFSAARAVGLLDDEAERTIVSGLSAGIRNPRSGTASSVREKSCVVCRTLPLFPPLPPEEPYPVEALGPVLSQAARAISRSVQVPTAIAGQSVLAAASLAAQPLADVRMPFGQCRPLSLFFVSIAASGDRKSTADTEALKPIETGSRSFG